ncbi:39S ribosomal protein L13, mitochondrial isoform X1 [Leptopilina boulardi]|uniref:39S ribosomal protein L13, mitochondrial isoform X1 n=1 Tax=Leptopilina boulardi TaxID=63433 RepID=UPI0021F66DD6|nr:39S ribosomal protein L13, mitochondrial isoform X1 [Leptopilina boulardi]
MSLLRRSQQWGTFSRIWHVYDAKWQDPYLTAELLKKYLSGTYKPIYHPMNDCGDNVVVINSKDIALRGDDWQKRMYFHHTGYAKGATYTLAWELHSKDPTMIVRKALYSAMDKNLNRRYAMQRLHIFPDSEVPKEIKRNISNQIQQISTIPVRLDHIPEDVRAEFPQLLKYPEEYVRR